MPFVNTAMQCNNTTIDFFLYSVTLIYKVNFQNPVCLNLASDLSIPYPYTSESIAAPYSEIHCCIVMIVV